MEESKLDPSLLKKLPSRWSKKAAVVATMAFVGTITLSGCDFLPSIHHGGAGMVPHYVQHRTEQEIIGRIPMRDPIPPDVLQAQLDTAINAAELNYRTHFGGGGSGPFYVVHITEQEALGIIRANLEMVGFQFNYIPPDSTVEMHWQTDFGIDLFDEAKGVGISHISWEMNNQPFFSHGGNRLANSVTEAFAQQDNDFSVGVFFNPSTNVSAGQRWWDWEARRGEEFEPPTEEEIAQTQEEVKATLIAQLNDQVQAFIRLLESEGIL